MKVLLISNLCPPNCIGGYEIACYNVAMDLDARGHEVKLLTTQSHIPSTKDPSFVERSLDLRSFLPNDVRHESLDRLLSHEAAVSNYRNTYTLIQEIRHFEPDVVYLFNLFGIGGLALIDVLNVGGIPWVLHLMDRVPELLKSGSSHAVRSVFNAASSEIYSRGTIISMSQTLIDEISDVAGVTFAQGVRFIPGWVDGKRIQAKTRYQADGVTRFVNAGTVQAHKGIDLIIEASAHLHHAGLHDFYVDIYGSGHIAHYRDACRRYGVDQCVRFRGDVQQSSLIKKYRDYDCFLFPTWEREPFGFAPIEAAAAGCVPIITAQCGAAERLVNGVHCIKIARQTDALANVMRKVICQEVELARLGRAGRNLTQTDLSFQRCMDQIENILIENSGNHYVRKTKYSRLILLVYMKHMLSIDLCFGNH